MNLENLLERLDALETKSREPANHERELLMKELDAIRDEAKNLQLEPEEHARLIARTEELAAKLSTASQEQAPPEEGAADEPDKKAEQGMLPAPPEPMAALGAPEPHAALEAPAVVMGPPSGPSGPAVPLGPPQAEEESGAAPQGEGAEKETDGEKTAGTESARQKPISAETAAEMARIETEVNQVLSISEEFDPDQSRPRSVFELRNHVKELQKQLKSLPAARQLRENLRLRLQEAWQKTQDFLAKYSELGKKELGEFYERADRIAKTAEEADSFDGIRKNREEIKRMQQDLRAAHLKREEFQKIRKRLQGIWDVLDKLWVRLRDEAKKEVEAFMPRVLEVREKAESASGAEELKTAGDALKETQAELKERPFARMDKDKLYRQLQKVWETLQEKWNSLRTGKAEAVLKFEDKLQEVQAVIDSAEDTEGFTKGREAVKSLQDEIRSANLPRPDRNRYSETLQQAWEALMQKQEEWYKRGAEGKD
ncbi:MAG: hypothetical protein ACYS8W_05905 [Planctomycetota bacterium]|jgi:hypothetical protein